LELARVFAKGLGERNQGLVLVRKLIRVQLPDFGHGTRSLLAGARRLAACEEHLNQFFELAESPSDLLQASARQIVAGVQLEQLSVDALGFGQVLLVALE
jgi:hypothetical protein